MGFFIIVRKCKCTLARAYYMREALGKISTKKYILLPKDFEWLRLGMKIFEQPSITIYCLFFKKNKIFEEMVDSMKEA